MYWKLLIQYSALSFPASRYLGLMFIKSRCIYSSQGFLAAVSESAKLMEYIGMKLDKG